jgi:hypothetical protein
MVDLVADIPEDWDGTVSCNGYVDPTPTDFDGTVRVNVNEATERVSATINLASNVTSFTDGDATLTNIDGGQCSIDIVNALAGYMGIGDTFTFLNQNLELVGEELVVGYATSLKENIESECSAP